MSHAKKDPASSARVEQSIVAARDGSYSALGQLLDHYRDYLLRVANDELRSDLVPKVAPSDLVQETFLQAAKRFPKFRGTTESELRGWLRRILINRLRDTNKHYFRRHKRTISREVSLDAEGQNQGLIQDLQCPAAPPGEQLIASETSAHVQQALEKLPEIYRRVIELRHFQRRTLQQAGVELDRSPDAVRKLWCRAVERLIHELAGK